MVHVLGSVLEPIETKKPIAIAHLANNHLVMGAGIALVIAKRWPDVQKSLLSAGTQHPHGAMGWNDYLDVELAPGRTATICSMVAQTLDHRFPISMPALEDCLWALDAAAKKDRATVHIPRIGCGLARGRWEDISQIIPGGWYVYTMPNEQQLFPPEKYVTPVSA